VKTKLMILVTLLLGGSVSYASFECFEKSGKVKVVALHNKLDSTGLVFISVAGQKKLELKTQVEALSNRLGNYYSYEFPDDETRLHIKETNKLVNSYPGCQNGRRITCDYDWVTSYVGHLELNGKSYALACKAI
jgi:hypothetical protein